MTVHRVRTCACGHAAEPFHLGGKGRCLYGHSHVMGGCTCDGFHRRSRAAATDPEIAPLAAVDVSLAEATGAVIQALIVFLRALPAQPKVTNPLVGIPGSTIKVVEASPPKRPTDQDDGRQKPRAKSEGGLTRLTSALLTVLANRRHQPTTRAQLAILSTYSIESGSFAQGLASLRGAGLITTGQPIFITEAGARAIGPVKPMPTGPALLDHWVGALSKAEGTLLRAIADARPLILSRVELARASDYSPDSGSFASAIAKLRTLELIGRRENRLAEAFEARRSS